MTDPADGDTQEMPVVSDSDTDTGEVTPLRALAQPARVEAAALSDPGKVRKNNEDHYLVARIGRSLDSLFTNLPAGEIPDRFDQSGYMMMVADGLGGAAGGEVASRLAISTLVNIVLDVPDWILNLDDEHAAELADRAVGYYRDVHTALCERSQANPKLSGMGTTMTAAYSVGMDLFIAHVGDSRAYLFRKGRLRQLTHDHTHAQRLADEGLIAHEAVAKHELRHVLTNALGGHGGALDVEIQRQHLVDQDRLLMCTDGLSDVLDDATIAKLLAANEDAQAACQALLQAALDAGGPDNVTIVLARFVAL